MSVTPIENIIDIQNFRNQAIVSDPTNVSSATPRHKNAVVASTSSTAATGPSAVIASSSSSASGINSCVLGSEESTATGTSSIVSSSYDSKTTSNQSAVLSSRRCETIEPNATVLSSTRVVNTVPNSVAIGYSETGCPSHDNIKILMKADTGSIRYAGSITTGSGTGDFAELMPNGTGQEILPGTIVALRNGSVHPANKNDWICGVVSYTAAILAGDTPFCWQGRYLTDEWGRLLYETIPDPNYQGPDVPPSITVIKENPEWDINVVQTSRFNRPTEWTPVGMIGQVLVRTGQQVNIDDMLEPVNGLGMVSKNKTRFRVMKVTKNFDGDYGIAKCVFVASRE